MGLGIRNTIQRFSRDASRWAERSHREASRVSTRVTHPRIRVRAAVAASGTPVDRYWGVHTVQSRPFLSAVESERYLEERNALFPLFPEFMGLYDAPSGAAVLDYGCGPGDDVIGWLLRSPAGKVIGMDISPRALDLLRHRVALHGVPAGRVELVRIADAEAVIPLPDAAVDHVHCGGVIHHTSHPERILGELHRVLRPGGTGSIMVYNRDGVMFHVYIAYVRQVLEGAYAGLTVEEAFQRSTDGPECPVSIAYRPADFVRMCEQAGFEAEFVGGYHNVQELGWFRDHAQRAAADERLGAEHRAFAAELVADGRGHPLYRGKHAGTGGVYRLTRPA